LIKMLPSLSPTGLWFEPRFAAAMLRCGSYLEGWCHVHHKLNSHFLIPWRFFSMFGDHKKKRRKKKRHFKLKRNVALVNALLASGLCNHQLSLPPCLDLLECVLHRILKKILIFSGKI
jgi:hypothetical protein